jgi:hypothetical protein
MLPNSCCSKPPTAAGSSKPSNRAPRRSIRPAASVIDSPNGIDMMANCGSYAPDALAAIYARLEAHLAAVLAPAMREAGSMTAPEVAYILRVATTAIKASADNLPTLRQVVAGMITMAMATAAASAQPA